MANVSHVNPSSVAANQQANKQSVRDKVLDIFAASPVARLTVEDIFAEFKNRQWKTSETNSVSTTLSHLTNVGLLRQVAGTTPTQWERTQLKHPLPDGGKITIKEKVNGQIVEVPLSTQEIERRLQGMRGGLSSVESLIQQGTSISPASSPLQDYVDLIDKVLLVYKGHQDRTNDPEYIRRVALGL